METNVVKIKQIIQPKKTENTKSSAKDFQKAVDNVKQIADQVKGK